MLATFAQALDQCQGSSVRVVAEPVLGLTEIAEYLGISRQRVHQLAKTDGFPEPLARLRQGNVWLLEDVEQWASKTGRSQSAQSPQDDHK